MDYMRQASLQAFPTFYSIIAASNTKIHTSMHPIWGLLGS